MNGRNGARAPHLGEGLGREGHLAAAVGVAHGQLERALRRAPPPLEQVFIQNKDKEIGVEKDLFSFFFNYNVLTFLCFRFPP
jgi:hypothetical protein